MPKILTFLILLLAFAKISYSQGSWSYLGTIPSGAAINSIAVVDQNVIFVAAKGNGLYRTLNGGSTWELKNTGLAASGDLYGISATDSLNCWVGWLKSTGTPASIYRTTDGGTSWTLQWTLAGTFPDGIKMFTPDYGIAIGDPTGNGQPYQFRYTTNGGTTWNLSPTSPIAENEYGVINAFDFIDTNIIWVGSASTVANATTCKIYNTSTGINGTWLNTIVAGTGGTQGLYYQAIAFLDKNYGMAGSNGSDIVKTTDGGATWTAIAPPNGITTFAAINMYGFKDGSNIIKMSLVDTTPVYHCFKTTNLGSTWTEEVLPSQGSTNGMQHMQFVNSSLGFSGGLAGTLLKFSNPASAVQKENILPDNYTLTQNFPNPFNPTTIIKYQIPQNSYVSLKVFNSLGQEVATLVNGMINAGTHDVQFNASNLSSGVYFYVIKAGDNFFQSQKMMLLK
ncbi:MAG: T9SS type A sorting domain-containing protein [Ignavibacteriaceae bacterium]|nr:T9SS type A sorting domain-containing protein [Ignavibacteriaceae bacterium]